MEDLQDTLVIMGVAHTQLFNGDGGIELIILNPATGEDFTMPISEEQAELILRKKMGGPDGSSEGLRQAEVAPARNANAVRDPAEVEQF